MHIMNLNDFLLLEKKIAQIVSNIDIKFSFNVIKSPHAHQRANKRGKISDDAIYWAINHFMYDIAKRIVEGKIVDGQNFVIASDEMMLAMPIVAEFIKDNHWKLTIKTVWNESEGHRIRVGRGQLVIGRD